VGVQATNRDEIVAMDKRYVWHPYTAMDDYRANVDPLVIECATGSRLFDVNGQSYLDGNASWWVSTLGHNHPRLVAALARQAEKLCHTSLAGVTHGGAAQLAEAICKAAPHGLDHVFYSDDGSTAVEVAMKMALQYWSQNGRPARRRFVSLQNAFHGETLGVTSLCGVDIFRHLFEGSTLECVRVPAPTGEVSLDECLSKLSAVLVNQADSVAALVVEPIVQGAAGMRMYPAEFLRVARELCTKHDIFLVADEVFTGYGRTGPMWASEHAGVSPDLLCTAKGFSGGVLPMAATLTTERIFEGFGGARERAFYYGHSFCGNPLGCALALETLRIFEEESILERARPKALKLADAFATLESVPGVSHTRSIGMVGAIDLVGEQGYLANTGWRVYAEALRRGAYLRPLGNVVYVTPALTIPDPDLDELLSIVESSVRAVVETA